LKIFISIFFLLTGSFFAKAQIKDKNISRDTSYTLYGTAIKMHKKFSFAVLVNDSLPGNVKEVKNIVYKKLGMRKLHLDIFYPTGSKINKFPGLLMIHGGGWRTGDRTMVIPMAERLAAKGFVTVAVEYRLSIEALYPAAVYDLKAAIRWMRANSGKYMIDSNKIAVYGCSAGGHLAALVGTTNGIKRFEGEDDFDNHSSNVQAIVDVDGVLDFFGKGSEEITKKSGKPSAAHLWFGVSAKQDSSVWKDAGPFNHTVKNTPPILFLNSSQARFHAGRDEMINKLKKFNIYYEVHTLPHTIHTFWLFYPWFQNTLSYTTKFLDKVLSVK
jgi:acetyl esterase/lipase